MASASTSSPKGKEVLDVDDDAKLRPRKWDDPPEEIPEDITPMLLVHKGEYVTFTDREVLQLGFTATNACLVARVPKEGNQETVGLGDPNSTLVIIDLPTAKRKNITPPTNGYRCRGGFALCPGAGTSALACVFDRYWEQRYYNNTWFYELEVFDLLAEKRVFKLGLQIQAPIAWSPDMCHIVAVDIRNSTRIVVVNTKHPLKTRTERTIAVHSGPITHLAVSPDGNSIISAAEDGAIRVTGLNSGRTLRKATVDVRGPASMMQVSPDGDRIAMVWGRQVILWRLKADQISEYNLDAVRKSEGWPLAISPDCQYLVCRTEDGVDVSSLESGLRQGDYPTGHRGLITAAAFTNNNKWLAIGRMDGKIDMLEVITVGDC